jgi:predicted nucleic acid-binding protein
MAFPQKNKENSVFLDSTVLIAAAISDHGRARDLVLDGLRGRFRLCLSTLVLRETERNLSKKRPKALPFFETLRATLSFVVVDPPTSSVLQIARTIEAKDAPIVAAAVAAGATYIATYDRRHLLGKKAEVQGNFSVTVATPDEILSRLTR